MMVDVLMDGGVLAWEELDVFTERLAVRAVRFPAGSTYLEPWHERCEGCGGSGHLGLRVPRQLGPCELCWGTGHVLFAFELETRGYRLPPTRLVPAAVLAAVGSLD
jgi:hypothetical protein